MNISAYEKAFQEINVNTDEIITGIKTRLDKKSNEPRINLSVKPFYKYITVLVLILTLTTFNLLSKVYIPDFTITVYASDLNDEVVLSNNPITVTALSQVNMEEYDTDSGIGSIMFNLELKCQGENIRSIEYKLSDKTITRENRSQADAWFAETIIYEAGITEAIDHTNDKDAYMIQIDGEKKYVTKMIGNKYLVDYENQNNKDYLIVLNTNHYDRTDLTGKSLTITVIITLTDGSSFKKYLSINPIIESDGNTIPSLEIKVDK